MTTARRRSAAGFSTGSQEARTKNAAHTSPLAMRIASNAMRTVPLHFWCNFREVIANGVPKDKLKCLSLMLFAYLKNENAYICH